jgi:membrane protease YdiL (CAAX protease family)
MFALILLVGVVVVMWITQSLSLLSAGQPIRLRIDHAGLPRKLQQVNRAFTNMAFAGVLIAYPLLRGQSPWHYYAGLFPLDGRTAGVFNGVAAALIYLGLLYACWLVTDNIYLRPLSDARRLGARLAAVPLSAVVGAGMEELLFRAMLLAGLLEWLHPLPAVVIGTVVFAGAHYVRRVKRYWTFPGHLALGMLLCVSFWCTGALWLPLGLHAGGILIIMGLRPLVRYVGSPWVVGASIYPYAGAVGVIGLSILTLNMWYLFGARP